MLGEPRPKPSGTGLFNPCMSDVFVVLESSNVTYFK